MAPPSGSALRCATSHSTTNIELESGRVYVTGVQALVRLLMLQRQRDVLAGLEYRRLRLRLSRLAAGRARPVALERGEVSSTRATSSSSRD